MDKAEIIKELEAFPYSREDYWVLTGSAMVLYGIKEHSASTAIRSVMVSISKFLQQRFLMRDFYD
jgi:hypothetical protein